MMIGLQVNERPIARAYSIASSIYADELEFLSIKVKDGPLTSHLQHLARGDQILLGQKATGTLVLDNLLPGRRLYLLATGTGLAPFMSVIRDPECYDKFDEVVLVHGVRYAKELAYHDKLASKEFCDELPDPSVSDRFRYRPIISREPYHRMGRITSHLGSCKILDCDNLPPVRLNDDRFMICGGDAMLQQVTDFLAAQGFSEGSNRHQGHYVLERAFVAR